MLPLRHTVTHPVEERKATTAAGKRAGWPYEVSVKVQAAVSTVKGRSSLQRSAGGRVRGLRVRCVVVADVPLVVVDVHEIPLVDAVSTAQAFDALGAADEPGEG